MFSQGAILTTNSIILQASVGHILYNGKAIYLRKGFYYELTLANWLAKFLVNLHRSPGLVDFPVRQADFSGHLLD